MQFDDQPTRALGDVVAAVLEEEAGACRQRIYPSLTTLGLFIEQALSSDGACQDAVGRLDMVQAPVDLMRQCRNFAAKRERDVPG